MSNKNELWVIKLGGKLLENESLMRQFITELQSLKSSFILVHGGGVYATRLAEQLGVPVQMVEGRRITDKEALDIALMTYAGLLNKKLVAQLQAIGINALGLTGADGNAVPAQKRDKNSIDYGFVGDPITSEINTELLNQLIVLQITPVFCALSHDKSGQMLNTNADTMAQSIAIAMSSQFTVKLLYLFEMQGVMKDRKDLKSLIKSIKSDEILNLISSGVISEGMIPKVQNARMAVEFGVESVIIGSPENLESILINEKDSATHVIK